jgi:hypothetical protein
MICAAVILLNALSVAKVKGLTLPYFRLIISLRPEHGFNRSFRVCSFGAGGPFPADKTELAGKTLTEQFRIGNQFARTPQQLYQKIKRSSK